MMPDEPFDRLHLTRLEPQTRRNFTGDFRAEYRMIFGPPLANIMQQKGHIEYFSVQTLGQYSAATGNSSINSPRSIAARWLIV